MLEYVLMVLNKIGATILILSVCGSVAYYLPLSLKEWYTEYKKSHEHYEIMRKSNQIKENYEKNLAEMQYIKKMKKAVEENSVNE